VRYIAWAALGCALGCGAALAQTCDLSDYKPLDGLKATARADGLEVSWQGERGQELRAVFAIQNGQPFIRELAVRKAGKWNVLGHDLNPEFQVTTAKRRLSGQ
jgi:hypothetical protein